MDTKHTTLEDLNIRYFKLMNGETIISFVHDTVDVNHNMILEEPMSVSTDDANEYVLTPWLPFSSESIHLLDYYQVLIESDVANWMKAQYLKLVLDVSVSIENNHSIDTDTVLH